LGRHNQSGVTMQIRILEVSPVEDMGKYSKVNVSYSADGRNQEKAIMSFTAAL
jgi:hypothetical protein